MRGAEWDVEEGRWDFAVGPRAGTSAAGSLDLGMAPGKWDLGMRMQAGVEQ